MPHQDLNDPKSLLPPEKLKHISEPPTGSNHMPTFPDPPPYVGPLTNPSVIKYPISPAG